MTLFQRVEAIEAALVVLQANPAGGVSQADLAALSLTVANIGTQVDGLRADVGVPTPPPAPPTA